MLVNGHTTLGRFDQDREPVLAESAETQEREAGKPEGSRQDDQTWEKKERDGGQVGKEIAGLGGGPVQPEPALAVRMVRRVGPG